MNTFIKHLYGFDILRTEKGNIMIRQPDKRRKRILYFYGEHAVEEAEHYILQLEKQGEI